MNIKLILVAPKSKNQSIKVTKTRFVIGRSTSADLRINSSSVSRNHCEIFEKNDKVYIRDLNSSNGTQLDGKRLDEIKKLKPGSQLQVGKYVFNVAKLDQPRVAKLEQPKTEKKRNDDSDIDLSHLKIDWSDSDSSGFDFSKLQNDEAVDENGTTLLNVSLAENPAPSNTEKDSDKTVDLLHSIESNEEADEKENENAPESSKEKIKFSTEKETDNTVDAASDVLNNFFGRR